MRSTFISGWILSEDSIDSISRADLFAIFNIALVKQFPNSFNQFVYSWTTTGTAI